LAKAGAVSSSLLNIAGSQLQTVSTERQHNVGLVSVHVDGEVQVTKDTQLTFVS